MISVTVKHTLNAYTLWVNKFVWIIGCFFPLQFFPLCLFMHRARTEYRGPGLPSRMITQTLLSSCSIFDHSCYNILFDVFYLHLSFLVILYYLSNRHNAISGWVHPYSSMWKTCYAGTFIYREVQHFFGRAQKTLLVFFKLLQREWTSASETFLSRKRAAA
jgi:hypothetical protein